MPIYTLSQKTGRLRLIWHNFTNSQHLLIIFRRKRPYPIFNWCKKFLNWPRTSCVVSITTVTTWHTRTVNFWADFEQRIIDRAINEWQLTDLFMAPQPVLHWKHYVLLCPFVWWHSGGNGWFAPIAGHRTEEQKIVGLCQRWKTASSSSSSSSVYCRKNKNFVLQFERLFQL